MVTRNHKRTKPYPTDVVAQVRHLYEQGMTQYEVADAIGRSQRYVGDLMRHHGLTARKPASSDAEVLDRILARCTETSDGCWIWNGARSPKGYGRVRHQGKSQPTHRVVYRLMIGDLPSDLECDHLCRNTTCCNPHHIEPVTKTENLRRANEARAMTA